MTTFERRVRRAALVADAAFVFAVIAALLLRITGFDALALAAGAFAVLTSLWMVVGHVALVLMTADAESRRATAHVLLLLSNLSLVFAVLPFVAAPTSFGRGFHHDEPSTLLGLPTGFVVIGMGIAGIVVGRLWIHRILQEGREPESNDRFWWSRA